MVERAISDDFSIKNTLFLVIIDVCLTHFSLDIYFRETYLDHTRKIPMLKDEDRVAGLILLLNFWFIKKDSLIFFLILFSQQNASIIVSLIAIVNRDHRNYRDNCDHRDSCDHRDDQKLQ